MPVAASVTVYQPPTSPSRATAAYAAVTAAAEEEEEEVEVEDVEEVEEVEEVDTALAHAFCKDIVKASWTALGAKSVLQRLCPFIVGRDRGWFQCFFLVVEIYLFYFN